MPFDTMIIVRILKEQKQQLSKLAVSFGISKSALIRNSLVLVLEEKKNSAMLKRIVQLAKEERKKSLLARLVRNKR